ncbi:MAG: lysine--tRNA ligase [Parcubacteria group bacterium]
MPGTAAERLRIERTAKLVELKRGGVDPYPSHTDRTHLAAQVIRSFADLSSKSVEVAVAGRIRALRKLGKAAFMVLEDGSGRLQIFLQRDQLGDDYRILKYLEVGDFASARGLLFTTKSGEKSIRALKLTVLAKALRPLPAKFHGLKDQELRFRRRELDLIVNAEIRELFKKRALFLRHLRDFLDSRGFLEVETPVLQPLAGGTEAKPFTTHHEALNLELYLRIAPELYLKRLIVGGFEQVYELGKIFRNEGISPQHLQEFTELEFYWAYQSQERLLPFVEELLTSVLQKTYGTLEFTYGKQQLNFSTPFKRLDYYEAVQQASGINLANVTSAEELRKLINKNRLAVHLEPDMALGRMIDNLFKSTVRPAIVQPTYVTGYPLATSPLAKRDPKQPVRAERFQLLVAGFEIANAYSELNDPVDQQERFAEQARIREAGDMEAHVNDRDFVEALEYGMPPTAGFGMGIDRLLTLVHNAKNVREVVFFPLLRPQDQK